MLYNCIIFTPGELEGLMLFVIDRKYQSGKFLIFNFSQDDSVTEIIKKVRDKRPELMIYEIKNKAFFMKALIFLLSFFVKKLLLSFPASKKKSLKKLCGFYQQVYLFRDSICPYINSRHFDLKDTQEKMIYEADFIDFSGEKIIAIENNIKDYVSFWMENNMNTENNTVLIFTKYVDDLYQKEYNDAVENIIFKVKRLGYKPVIFKHPRDSSSSKNYIPYIEDSYYMNRLSGCQMVISFHSSVSYVFFNFTRSHVIEVFDERWFHSGKANQSRFKTYTNFSGNVVDVLDYLERLPYR